MSYYGRMDEICSNPIDKRIGIMLKELNEHVIAQLAKAEPAKRDSLPNQLGIKKVKKRCLKQSLSNALNASA